jgi:hypothetical protein
MIVSLDDQLEWQESLKSHSPRTPTAPEALQSLRRNSPTPTPSRGTVGLKSPESLKELSVSSGLEALEKLKESIVTSTCKIHGDYLSFNDGTFLPLSMLLPLQVKPVERHEDGEVRRSDSFSPVTLGGAWLSMIAEHSYESQLASLLRSRKNIEELSLDDRQVLNRFLHGSISTKGLIASRLWAGETSGMQLEKGQAELSLDTDDVLSRRLRRRNNFIALEDRKSILTDQQNRLRRLLARELQRQHSVRTSGNASGQTPASVGPSLTSSVSSAVPVVPVSNLLARESSSKGEVTDSSIEPVSGVTSVVQEARVNPSRQPEIVSLQTKLRCLQIEWFRLCYRLKSLDETERVCERRLKRMRYALTPLLLCIAL